MCSQFFIAKTVQVITIGHMSFKIANNLVDDVWHVKLMSTLPWTSAKVTVRRKTSETTGTSSDMPTVQRLSRQSSDVTGSVSTTHDVTPSSAGRSHVPRRIRPRREDDNSSSCSSMEALNHKSNDIWNDNPLYADKRQQRRQQKKLGIHSPRNVVDTEPRDDVFMETQHADGSSPLSAASFKSEPALHNTLIIQDSANMPESDVCRGSMIDCISVAAPDDTVIKPSQLRESMRQRRTPPCKGSADDMAITDRTPSIRRARSLRETKRTPSIERETGFVRKKIAAIVSSSAAPAAVANSDLRSPEVITASLSSVSPSSAGPYTFSMPLSTEATHKKIVQSTDKHMSPYHETEVAGSVSYEQLLHNYNQVC